MKKYIIILVVCIICIHSQNEKKYNISYEMNALSQKVNLDFIGENKAVMYLFDVAACNNPAGKLCPACNTLEIEQFYFSKNFKRKKAREGFSLHTINANLKNSLITYKFFKNEEKVWYMKRYYSILLYFEGSFFPDFQKIDESITVEIVSLDQVNDITDMIEDYYKRKQTFKELALN